jgi:hypothetical protein
MDQIMASTSQVVTLLLRLSAAIRNPASHDRWLNSRQIDTYAFQVHGINHVKAKFPKISPKLAQRLGTAIAMRRGYHKYREKHHTKLTAGLCDDDDDERTVIESTTASSLPKNAKELYLDVLLENDKGSDSGRTATSFATSTTLEDGLRVPLPRGEIYDTPFECPLCFNMVNVGNGAAWKLVPDPLLNFRATKPSKEARLLRPPAVCLPLRRL